MTSRPARTVSISVDRAPDVVYTYLTDPRHLPGWAPGFARSVHEQGDGWVVETTAGPMRIEFAPANGFGVVDHRVTSDDGLDSVNPMRVIGNGDGSEVLFTPFWPAGIAVEEFQRDLDRVEADLRALKRVLEGR